jgi:hypothetical protein
MLTLIVSFVLLWQVFPDSEKVLVVQKGLDDHYETEIGWFWVTLLFINAII